MFGKLLLLVGLFLLWRVLRRAIGAASRRRESPRPGSGGESSDQAYENLTRQDISDADFEEIDDEGS
jgi:ABC-type nickel/cobalt efflux system permease component RcnA